ncbi:MAG: family oxidoreductase [Alphaproteobacteria bacterium]|nr:family oxidoreductase [Alphaproteobacteria bacterium]
MSREFANKVVWVVGASGGLGSAIAQEFLRAGAKVALSGRNGEKLKAVIAGQPDASHALLLPIDITAPAEVDAAAAKIVERFGRIDVLVNSTAVSTFGDFLKLDDAAWRQVYEAKLFAYARTMRAAMPHMLRQQRGAIVNVSGNGGKYPHFPSHIAGSSGNAAVNLMTKEVSDIYIGQGIRANCIAPGAIRSPRLDSITDADKALKPAANDKSAADAAAEKMRPPGAAADIAEAALFLASDRARHINGIVLTVDGGATPTTA